MYIKNRKASYEYEFLEKFTAGIVLRGTEIKSVRLGKVNMQDAFCYINKGEVFIKGLLISKYEFGTIYNHEPSRTKKLLLNKREIRKLSKGLEEKGLTVVATSMFISDRGLAKVNIALAKGKKLFDKRNSLKEKAAKRLIKDNMG